MKKDLLHIYVQNHLSVFYLPVLIVGLFLWLRFYLHGLPDQSGIIISVCLLVISSAFFLKQQILYRSFLKENIGKQNNYPRLVATIIFNKIGYIAPWLLIIFWPYQTDYIFDHILGFIFVFLAIGAYVSISTSCLALFLADITLQIIAASIILFINRTSIESSYIFFGLMIFTAYAFLIGRKLHSSSKELIDKNYKLIETVEKVEQANKAKSDFLSMISHEIRTPMHGIMSTVEHLYESKLTVKQKESLKVVTQCSKTLLSMLNDILDFSKIEAKKIDIENIDFNFHRLINDSANIVKFSAENKNIKLGITIGNETPKFICSDSIRLQQVILNLLNNAIKFTENGSVTLKTNIIDKDNTPHIRIEVIDTGIGISPENQEKLFERFEQAESSTTRQYGGTGLGLSIAQELIHLMNGEVGVSSQKDEGSTFWLEIPYVPANEIQTTSIQAKDKNVTLPKELRVLVAEDNHINQKTIQRILESQYCLFDIVENGEDVLNNIRQNTYDCILMDMNMPIMDGIEATKNIRGTKGKFSQPPILGLTATTEKNMIATFYDAGINDHITKPFSKNELLECISKNITDSYTTHDNERNISPKLQEIWDDFGEDFFISFVQDSIDEIEKLQASLHDLYDQKSYTSIHAIVHDICGVSGNIGMTNSYALSKAIETQCLQENYDDLSISIENLDHAIKEESAQTKKSIKEKTN